MASIPEPTATTAKAIDDYHASRKEKPRPHMGVSQLGHPCDRWLWLSFRWAIQEDFPGRILRLFRRGHHEENWIVQDLRAAGVDIHSTGGQQSRVEFGSHVSGSLDGIIEKGLVESPNKQHIAEFKTHSDKSFKDLQKHGVEKSKLQHFVQLQVYMLGKGVRDGFYLAVNKNTDEIYTERIKLNNEFAEKYVKRGQTIACTDIMPHPVSTDPSWYQCGYCPAKSFCHQKEPTKHVNCRTCAHSTALEDNTWACELHRSGAIPLEFQHTGCDSHVLHPHLVPWKMDQEKTTNEIAAWVIGEKTVLNGAYSPDVYTSTEILANPVACASGEMRPFREAFGAKVIAE